VVNATPNLSLDPAGAASSETLPARRPAPETPLWTKPRNGRRVGLTEAVLNVARTLG